MKNASTENSHGENQVSTSVFADEELTHMVFYRHELDLCIYSYINSYLRFLLKLGTMYSSLHLASFLPQSVLSAFCLLSVFCHLNVRLYIYQTYD